MAEDRRRGLNCLLSYPLRGEIQILKIRIDALGHGVEMIADESTGRNQRAYYPHRLAPARFYIRVLLVGHSERKTFADWIQRYADFVMDPGLAGGGAFPAMRVLHPDRNFDREGVPLSGFEWGDRIGSIVWTPTVTFETTREPQDTEVWSTSRFVAASDPDLKYFWPAGTQLGGSAVPSGSYTVIVDGADGGSDPGQELVPAPHHNGTSTELVQRGDYGD
jgi:hypothetical protein